MNFVQFLTERRNNMYYLREHLRIGSTTNRQGKLVHFAEIEVFTTQTNDDGDMFQMMHIERLTMMRDENKLRKEALIRYRQFYPTKKTGRDAKRCESTYPGKQVIVYTATK